jgi:hypothetical protein
VRTEAIPGWRDDYRLVHRFAWRRVPTYGGMCWLDWYVTLEQRDTHGAWMILEIGRTRSMILDRHLN